MRLLINYILRRYSTLPKHILQQHPFEIPSLKEKLDTQKLSDPILEKVDIGFKFDKKVNIQVALSRSKYLRNFTRNPEIEEKARKRTLKIDLEQVSKESFSDLGPELAFNIASHYNIYKDVFDLAYFFPVVPLNVSYEMEKDENHVQVRPVFNGNILSSAETINSPIIYYDSSPDKYWSLLMTSLDSHMIDPSKEYIHWLITNIPSNNVEKGEELYDYLRPFFGKGTGYHRYVFILFQHTSNQPIQFNEYLSRIHKPCLSLDERTWSTLDFYRQFQDDLTPAGLSFFQSIWDDSLISFFHNKLKMRVPKFKYTVPFEGKIPKQVTYPKEHRFDTYIDMYRDPYDVGKEVILKKLRDVNPSPFLKPKRSEFLSFQDANLVTFWERDAYLRQNVGWGPYRYLFVADDDNETLSPIDHFE